MGMGIIFYIEIIISILFLLTLSQFEKFFAPTNHYAYCSNIFCEKHKKSVVALVSRCLAITFFTLITYYLFSFDSSKIIFVVFITQFIIEIPRIKNYKLYRFFNSKLRMYGFLESLFSILISTLISLFILSITNVFCIAIMLIIILLFILGNKISLIMIKTSYNYPLTDAYLDKFVTYRNLSFEKLNLEKKYKQYFESAGKKYNLDPKCMQAIISLEKFNRNSPIFHFLELLLIIFTPRLLEKNNSTLGCGQISIKNIKEYYGKVTRKILLDATNPKNNIMLCAFCLRKIIDSFFIEYNKGFYIDEEDSLTTGEKLETVILTNEEILWNYITAKYLTGFTLSRIKCVAIYTSFLTQCDIKKCLSKEQFEKLNNLKIL